MYKRQIQEAVAQTEEKAKKEPKKRERKASAPKEKKPKTESKETGKSPSVPAPAAATASSAPDHTDALVGQPCPLCGKGTVIKGKTAYGCSEWRNGCTYRKSFE